MAKKTFEAEESNEGGRDGVAPITPPKSAPATTSPVSDWRKLIGDGQFDLLPDAMYAELNKIVKAFALPDYRVLILYDEHDAISDYHSDRLYETASNGANNKLLLVLHSNGGSIEPAYLISKTLKRLSKHFNVAVPRRAKSAATLLALGGDEIHMGLMSQLGPIDPQFGGLPGFALNHALDIVADLTCKFPAAAEMFTKYLVAQVPVRTLGHYQRAGESAVQYAERLLAGKTLGQGKSGVEVATHLVTHYKDHGFVIDFEEARDLLGAAIVRQNTAEYLLADQIYRFLDFVSLYLWRKEMRLDWVGDMDDGFSCRPMKKS